MSELIIKFITSFIMPVSGFFIIKNISNNKVKLFCKRTIISLFSLGIANFLIYKVEYQSIITILNFCVMVVCYKFLFKIDIFNALLMCIFLMIVVFLSEAILYIVMEPTVTHWQLRSLTSSLIFGNLSIGVFSVLISKLRFFKKLCVKLCNKLEKSFRIQLFIMSLLWILVISILGYMIFISSKNSLSLWISFFVEVVFIVFMVVYLKDRDKFISLNEKFDTLYEYIQTIEDYLDNEQLNIHEYKNQLSVIRNMTTSPKIKKYIDSLVLDAQYHYSDWTLELKNLPNGGIKGLLYYKLAIAQSKNISIDINISDNCSEKIKNLSIDEVKQISRILGVYLDNAIEACILTDDKKISIEIYTMLNNLNFVIQNSTLLNFDISKVNKKGYSSKGINRGKGLYLINKIISKNENFITYTGMINNYFIQKLEVK